MAKSTTELQIKVTADGKGAVSGLAPVNAGLTELSANAEKSSSALDGLAGAHHIEIDDAEIKIVSEEMTKLQTQMREKIQLGLDTRTEQKQLSGLRATMRELQSGVKIPVKMENVDSVTSGERALSDLGRVAATSFPALNNIGFALTSVGKVSPVVKAGVAGIGAAFGTWKVAKLAADVQTTQLQLKALTGSTESAAQTFSDLQKFAADTPFELDQVTAAARALLVAGKTPSQLPATLTEIGNVATATGVPLEQMSVVFEQMFTKGKIANEELLQLAEAGVPVYQTLAKQLGTTTAGVAQMAQKGQIGADQIDKLIQNLGGLFPTSMSDQAKSFNGQLSTLHDTAVQLGQGLGTQVLPEMQAMAQALQDLLGFVQKLPAPVKEIGGAFLALAAGQKVFGSSLEKAGNSLTALKEKVGGAEGVTGKLKAGLGGVASAFNPWSLAITGGIALLSLWAAKQAAAKKKVDELSQGIDVQTGKLNKNGKAILANQIKGWGEDAGKAGISMEDLTKALVGGNAAFDDQIDVLKGVVAAHTTFHNIAGRGGVSSTASIMDDTAQAAQNLITNLESERGTMAKATDEAKKNADAQTAVKAATDGVSTSMVELNSTVNETAKAYQKALDGFNAFNQSASDNISTIFDYQGSLDDLRTSLAKGGTFAPTAEQGRSNWNALVQAGQDAGDRIATVLKTRGAAAAQTVYNNERTTLHTMLVNAGVQSNRAWQLINDVLKKPHEMHMELSKVDRAAVTADLARLNKRKARIEAQFDLPTGDGLNQRISGVIGRATAKLKPIDARINADVLKLDPSKAKLDDAANPDGKPRTADINTKVNLGSANRDLTAFVNQPRTAFVDVVTRHSTAGGAAPTAPTTPGTQPSRIITPQSAIPSGTQTAPGQSVQLAPKVTPVKVFLDGAEIADHITLRTQQLTPPGRRVA